MSVWKRHTTELFKVVFLVVISKMLDWLCQLAAEYFHRALDKETMKDPALTKSRDLVVSKYLNQARDYYVQWGATSLVRHLEQKYSSLLPPLASCDASISTTTDYTSVAGRSITVGITSASTAASPKQTTSTIGRSNFPPPPLPAAAIAAATTSLTNPTTTFDSNHMEDISVMTDDMWKDGSMQKQRSNTSMKT